MAKFHRPNNEKCLARIELWPIFIGLTMRGVWHELNFGQNS